MGMLAILFILGCAYWYKAWAVYVRQPLCNTKCLVFSTASAQERSKVDKYSDTPHSYFFATLSLKFLKCIFLHSGSCGCWNPQLRKVYKYEIAPDDAGLLAVAPRFSTPPRGWPKVCFAFSWSRPLVGSWLAAASFGVRFMAGQRLHFHVYANPPACARVLLFLFPFSNFLVGMLRKNSVPLWKGTSEMLWASPSGNTVLSRTRCMRKGWPFVRCAKPTSAATLVKSSDPWLPTRWLGAAFKLWLRAALRERGKGVPEGEGNPFSLEGFGRASPLWLFELSIMSEHFPRSRALAPMRSECGPPISRLVALAPGGFHSPPPHFFF